MSSFICLRAMDTGLSPSEWNLPVYTRVPVECIYRIFHQHNFQPVRAKNSVSDNLAVGRKCCVINSEAKVGSIRCNHDVMRFDVSCV